MNGLTDFLPPGRPRAAHAQPLEARGMASSSGSIDLPSFDRLPTHHPHLGVDGFEREGHVPFSFSNEGILPLCERHSLPDEDQSNFVDLLLPAESAVIPRPGGRVSDDHALNSNEPFGTDARVSITLGRVSTGFFHPRSFVRPDHVHHHLPASADPDATENFKLVDVEYSLRNPIHSIVTNNPSKNYKHIFTSEGVDFGDVNNGFTVRRLGTFIRSLRLSVRMGLELLPLSEKLIAKMKADLIDSCIGDSYFHCNHIFDVVRLVQDLIHSNRPNHSIIAADILKNVLDSDVALFSMGTDDHVPSVSEFADTRISSNSACGISFCPRRGWGFSPSGKCALAAGDGTYTEPFDRLPCTTFVASILAIITVLCFAARKCYKEWGPSCSLAAQFPCVATRGRKRCNLGFSKRCTLSLFTTTFLSDIISSTATCELGRDFRSGFLLAIENIGDLFLTAVDDLDNIGIPLFNALSLSSKFNVKEEIHDELFSGLESEWNEGDAFDVENLLGNNTRSLPGHPETHLNCPTGSGELDFAIYFNGVANKSGIVADITLLPSPMEKLSLSVAEVGVSYFFALSFSIDVEESTVVPGKNITKTTLGNIITDLRFSALGNIDQDISDVAASFGGNLDLSAGFRYSSMSGGWERDGSFDLVLDATTTESARANIRLLASDDFIYDSVPPTTRFDFDFCVFKAQMRDAITSLDLTGQMGDLIGHYFTHDDFGGSAIIGPVTDALALLVEKELNDTKTKMVEEIDNVQCSTIRSLHEMEVPVVGYRDERMLSAPSSFGDVVELLALASNESSLSINAGLFPTRKELAFDFALSINKIFASDAFVAAFNLVFDKLGHAQDQLDQVNNTFADPARLLQAVEAVASFKLEASFGIKVENIADFFSSESNSGSFIGKAFLRIDKLETTANIVAVEVFVNNIFSSVNISDGSLDLSVGFGLQSPSEFSLVTGGTFESGLTFSDQISGGRLEFAPLGKLHARLPIVATIGGDKDWNFVISFGDDDMFDDIDPTIVFDFNACKILDAFDTMLAKLGNVKIPAKNILKTVPTSGIDLFSAIDINSIFPDASDFLDGILEAKNEFYHLCNEAETTGVAPSIEDVISLIREEISVASDESLSTSSNSGSSRRSLRAHHLRRTQYQRPRRLRDERKGRSLLETTNLVENLLDGFRVDGGFDGEKIFVSLTLDLSKEAVSGVGDLLHKPLQLLGDDDASFLGEVFGFDENVNNTGFDSGDTAANIAFSASAHLE